MSSSPPLGRFLELALRTPCGRHTVLACSLPLHSVVSPSPRLPEPLLTLHSPREGRLPRAIPPVLGSGSSLPAGRRKAAGGPSVWASSGSSQALRVAVLRFSIPNVHLHHASERAPLRMCPGHPRPHLGSGVAKRSARLHQQRQLNVMAASEGMVLISSRWSRRACGGRWDSALGQPGQGCSVAQCGPWRGMEVPSSCPGGTPGVASRPGSHGESTAEPGWVAQPRPPGRHLLSRASPPRR